MPDPESKTATDDRIKHLFHPLIFNIYWDVLSSAMFSTSACLFIRTASPVSKLFQVQW